MKQRYWTWAVLVGYAIAAWIFEFEDSTNYIVAGVFILYGIGNFFEQNFRVLNENLINIQDEIQAIKNHLGLTQEHEEFMREVQMDKEINEIIKGSKSTKQ